MAFAVIGRAIESGLGSIAPFLPGIQPHFRMAATIISLCVTLLAIVILARIQGRISHLIPSRLLTLTEDGIYFDLPLQISGFVAWRDIASVGRTVRVRGIWSIVIEFKHKLPVGPTGAEKELSRLMLSGNQILPSGEEFLNAAQRYHARATGGH
jgi:hypothetical protein